MSLVSVDDSRTVSVAFCAVFFCTCNNGGGVRILATPSFVRQLMSIAGFFTSDDVMRCVGFGSLDFKWTRPFTTVGLLVEGACEDGGEGVCDVDCTIGEAVRMRGAEGSV